MDYTPYKRWFGVGIKTGGQLLVGGVETTEARLWNLGNGHSFDLEIIASRWGLGLGGSGGAVMVLGFGITSPFELDHEPANDWGVNVAITEKFISKSLFASLATAAAMAKVARATKVGKMSVDMLSQLRNLGHTVFAGYEASKRKGIVVLDVPFAGAGVELSAYVTRGKMYVTGSSDPDDADMLR